MLWQCAFWPSSGICHVVVNAVVIKKRTMLCRNFVFLVVPLLSLAGYFCSFTMFQSCIIDLIYNFLHVVINVLP